MAVRFDSVHRGDWVGEWENECFRSFYVCVCGSVGRVGPWVWKGVGRPCPPVRNNVVTPRHLFLVAHLCNQSWCLSVHPLISWSVPQCFAGDYYITAAAQMLC